MRKHTNRRTKRQNKPNKKKRDPSIFPMGKILVLMEFIIMLFAKIPVISATYVIKTTVICIIIYLCMVAVCKLLYYKRLSGATMRKIDKMSGKEFEDYLAILYKKHGFDVQMTPESCDFGADLILTERKSGKKICVQAKRYRGVVGESAVQQTLSGREYYSCTDAIIVTNSNYTDAAKALARKCGIKMIDRKSFGKEEMFLF